MAVIATVKDVGIDPAAGTARSQRPHKPVKAVEAVAPVADLGEDAEAVPDVEAVTITTNGMYDQEA